MKNSELIKDQSITLSKQIVFEGKPALIKVNIRHDDRCDNGHNTFSITGDIYQNRRHEIGGCIHDIIREHFPELQGAIGFHLCSTDGPLHYIANSMYHAENGNLDYARSTAIWPDAQLEDFTKENLENRLPKLMTLFYHTVKLLKLNY